MMGYGLYSYGLFGSILWIIFWIVIVHIIVRLIRGPRSRRMYYRGERGPGSEHSALDLLKERYVKGEINKQEFEEKKADIS